ncbi:hypothetical protein SDC9_110361 [bioreactor metagenome]|uniref:Uncharacterized protein n=1 Tax=bioreactor metagenome TaxID=1076179 RepID=A0A645BFT3_9ZZZZ
MFPCKTYQAIEVGEKRFVQAGKGAHLLKRDVIPLFVANGIDQPVIGRYGFDPVDNLPIRVIRRIIY